MENVYTKKKFVLIDKPVDEQEISIRTGFSRLAGYLLSLVEALLLLEFILLLFGGHNTGLVALVSEVAHPLVAPFLGIFGPSITDTLRLEVSLLSALAVYYLVGVLVISVLHLAVEHPHIHRAALQ